MTRETTERRSKDRISVEVPVSFSGAQVSSPQLSGSPVPAPTGHTRDLSMSGIFLYTDSQILLGSRVEMVLMLPPQLTHGEKRWVCCQASVVRVEPGGKEGAFGVAAEIETIATLPEIPT